MTFFTNFFSILRSSFLKRIDNFCYSTTFNRFHKRIWNKFWMTAFKCLFRNKLKCRLLCVHMVEMHENHLHILKEILNNAATFYKRTYIKCNRCKAQKLIRENNSLIFPNIAVIPLLHRGWSFFVYLFLCKFVMGVYFCNIANFQCHCHCRNREHPIQATNLAFPTLSLLQLVDRTRWMVQWLEV